MKGSTETLARRADALLTELHKREAVEIWGLGFRPIFAESRTFGETLVIFGELRPPPKTTLRPVNRLIDREPPTFTPSEIERFKIMARLSPRKRP